MLPPSSNTTVTLRSNNKPQRMTRAVIVGALLLFLLIRTAKLDRNHHSIPAYASLKLDTLGGAPPIMMSAIGTAIAGSTSSSSSTSASTSSSTTASIKRLSLEELVVATTSNAQATCPKGTRAVVFTPNWTNRSLLIHQVTSTPCLSKELYGATSKWNIFAGTHYIHQTNTDTLFEQDWPEFPHLLQLLPCLSDKGRNNHLRNSLAKALLVYEYGGLAVNTNLYPNKQDNSTIFNHLEEQEAIVFAKKRGQQVDSSIYYFRDPYHPLSYYLVNHLLAEIQNTDASVKNKDYAMKNAVNTFAGHDTREDFDLFKGMRQNVSVFHGRYNYTFQAAFLRNHVMELDVLEERTNATTMTSCSQLHFEKTMELKFVSVSRRKNDYRN